jgi:hypothetical protein
MTMNCNSRMKPSASVLMLLVCGVTASAVEVSTVKLPAIAHRPQVAVDARGTVHLVFGHREKRGDLLYVRYDEAKKEFSRPIRINSTPGCAAAFNMAVGRNGRVHVLIRPNAQYSKDRLGRPPKFNDLRYLLYCRLSDDGTVFEKERDLSGATFGFEGVGAILADGKGTVQVYWHGLSRPGREPTRRLFVVRSEDEGQTFTRPEPIRNKVTGACACCSMQGIVGADGKLYLAYRNALPGGNKDSYLLMSGDQGKTFAALRLEPWPDAGCPGSTYSLNSTRAGVFVAWDTLGKVSFARVDESVKPITAPTGGKKSRSPVVVGNARGQILFAWSEAKNLGQFRDGADLAWRLYDKDGKPLTGKQVLPASIARWSFPAVYAKSNGDFVIFHDGGTGK